MNPSQIRRAAREILDHALKAVDARAAVQRAIAVSGSRLSICEEDFDISTRNVYAVAMGKAARPMAAGLTTSLGSRLTSGVLSGAAVGDSSELEASGWQVFNGGHPLPNDHSIDSADAALNLLEKAKTEHALVIFLISGGGSAMMEKLQSDEITLDDLQKTNRLLVSCGANIAEVNSVRAAISEVKAGGMARRAPNCDQVSLIVSDTNDGDQKSVASGPTFEEGSSFNALEVVHRYELELKLPRSVMTVLGTSANQTPAPKQSATGKRSHHVLLTNQHALLAAEEKARQLGFITRIDLDISEQAIAEGCGMLIDAAGQLSEGHERPVCLISGGEFSCPVKGDGVGGRNSETVLRSVMEMNRRGLDKDRQMVVLSGGTDGIDGNSPAAGAIANETTIARARKAGLDPSEFLDRSDSFSFFDLLGDAVITGPTGTNVRDVRLILAM